MTQMQSVIVALMCATACGSEFHSPFSVPLGMAKAAAHSVPRNIGTEVWLVPAPAGNTLEMARQPETWSRARARVDVFGFYAVQAYDHPGFVCGIPCGENNMANLRTVVPGGMFKWLNDQGIRIAVEAGSVKPYQCTEEAIIDRAVNPVLTSLGNIEESGGRVSYIALDEPLASSTPSGDPRFGPGHIGCGLSSEQTAGLVKFYITKVHENFPHVEIGLIEPYPAFSAEEIMSFVLELEHAGVRLPFFHLDLHLQRQVRERADATTDVRRLREFFRAKGIPFAVIIFGEDGRSNEGYSADAWATARMVAATSGVTGQTVFQSWAESVPGDLTSLKDKPDNIPESDPFSHTGLMLRILDFLRIAPAQ